MLKLISISETRELVVLKGLCRIKVKESIADINIIAWMNGSNVPRRFKYICSSAIPTAIKIAMIFNKPFGLLLPPAASALHRIRNIFPKILMINFGS